MKKRDEARAKTASDEEWTIDDVRVPCLPSISLRFPHVNGTFRSAAFEEIPDATTSPGDLKNDEIKPSQQNRP